MQLELLRRASVERRATLARSLSSTTIELSRRALREQMRAASEQQLLDRWLTSNYGTDLALRVRRYVEARKL